MTPHRIAFLIGLAVTVLTTLAHPGGYFSSFVVGTCSGTIAVGVARLLMSRRG